MMRFTENLVQAETATTWRLQHTLLVRRNNMNLCNQLQWYLSVSNIILSKKQTNQRKLTPIWCYVKATTIDQVKTRNEPHGLSTNPNLTNYTHKLWRVQKKTLLQTLFAPIINKSQQLITTQYILLLEWKVKKSKNLERYALN